MRGLGRYVRGRARAYLDSYKFRRVTTLALAVRFRGSDYAPTFFYTCYEDGRGRRRWEFNSTGGDAYRRYADRTYAYVYGVKPWVEGDLDTAGLNRVRDACAEVTYD